MTDSGGSRSPGLSSPIPMALSSCRVICSARQEMSWPWVRTLPQDSMSFSGALDMHLKVTTTIPAGRVTWATEEACRLMPGRLPVCACVAGPAVRG